MTKKHGAASQNFYESLFIPGICADYRICFSSSGEEIVGFDVNVEKIISIDLNSFTKKTFDVPKFQTIGKCSFRDIANILRASLSIYIAIVLEKETNKLFVVYFTLHDQLQVLHELALDVDPFDEEVNMHIDLITVSINDIYFVQYVLEDSFTTINLTKLSINDRVEITAEHIFNHRIIQGQWICPFLFEKSICFLSGSNPLNEILSLQLFDSQRMQTMRITNQTEFQMNKVVVHVAGKYRNQIICCIASKDQKRNVILSLSLNRREWRLCFDLKEHALKHASLLFSCDGKMALNGLCLQENCMDWHLYHFSINQSFLPALYSENRFFPSLEQLSAILSNAAVNILHGGTSAENSIVMMLKVIQEIRNGKFTVPQITIYLNCLEQKDYYLSYFEKLGILTEKINFAAVGDACIEIDESSSAYIHGFPHLPYHVERKLCERRHRTVILLNKEVKDGCDQPREDNLRWHRMAARVESMEDAIELVIEKIKTINNKHKILSHPLNQFYPNWKKCFKAMTRSRTICIPPCADVDSSAIRNKTNIIMQGRDAERKVVDSLLSLEIGGILITGLKSKDFFDKMKKILPDFKEKESKLNVLKENAFEIDALFMHASYGILVFEIKSRVLQKDQIIMEDQSFLKAAKQLTNVPKGIETIYEVLENKQLSPKCLHCIAVYPNSFIPDKIMAGEKLGLHIWDSEDLQPENLRNQMNKISSEFEVREDLGALAKSLVEYRSLEFISQQHNVMAVHKLLERHMTLQDTNKKARTMISNKRRLSFDTSGEQPIYLSGEQLSALEIESKCQMISGLPGTGKTILILLKALMAAKNKKNGSVYIYFFNVHLDQKVQKILEFNACEGEKMPIMLDNFTKISDEDDIYCDEMTFRLDVAEFLRNRQQCNGKTIIAFTGFQTPSRIVEVEDWKDRNFLHEYEHMTLPTIFRGSKNIVEEWKTYFNELLPVNIGHDIAGQTVYKFLHPSTEAILRQLVEEMKPYVVEEADSEKISNQTLNHIAVLVDDIDFVSAVMSFLAAEGIPCGSAEEQVNNPNIVAVEFCTNCLSFEWPVVFAVALGSRYVVNSFHVIAFSRAIARLLVFERDFMEIQKTCDKQLNDSMTELLDMDFDHFSAIVKLGRAELHENDPVTYPTDLHLAIIRHNFCPIELRKFSMFANCATFMDIIEVIMRNLYIMQTFFQRYSAIFDNLRNDEYRFNEKVANVLLELWIKDVNNSVEISKKFYLETIERLKNFSEESKRMKPKEKLSKQQRMTLFKLRNLKAWKAINNSYVAIFLSFIFS